MDFIHRSNPLFSTRLEHHKKISQLLSYKQILDYRYANPFMSAYQYPTYNNFQAAVYPASQSYSGHSHYNQRSYGNYPSSSSYRSNNYQQQYQRSSYPSYSSYSSSNSYQPSTYSSASSSYSWYPQSSQQNYQAYNTYQQQPVFDSIINDLGLSSTSSSSSYSAAASSASDTKTYYEPISVNSVDIDAVSTLKSQEPAWQGIKLKIILGRGLN